LVEGSDGVLYGTTYHGGTGGSGTVFKINKDGSGYGVVWSFSSSLQDAQRPNSELIEGPDGALYGTTDYGGSASAGGTVYKLNKDGSGYTILHSFVGSNGDGDTPGAALLQSSNGAFYGTTEYAGMGAGCVFALSDAPLPSRVVSLSFTNGATANVLQCAGTAAIQYDVQCSTNLSSWAVLATMSSPTNGWFQYWHTNPPSPAAFYRLKLH
jgi:uncharacterized repeat protein (TIGR03803 family)